MTGVAAYEEINEVKTDMDHIYNQRDPRAYFRELRQLGYVIPGEAKPVFQNVIAQMRRRRGGTVHVIDLGCSYGVNAALLKYDLTMPELYDYWGTDKFAKASPQEVVGRDRDYFAGLEQTEDIEVIGLDQADRAVAFGEEIGLLDEGIAVNLEKEELPRSVLGDLAYVDLIASTGCVGYVTEKSFDKLMPAVNRGRPVWLANFVLRMFPFDAIADSLAKRGYVTEKLEGHSFVQRRFATREEQEQVIEQIVGHGLDPAGKESEGELHAEFYLSRPAHEAAEVPIERLQLA